MSCKNYKRRVQKLEGVTGSRIKDYVSRIGVVDAVSNYLSHDKDADNQLELFNNKPEPIIVDIRRKMKHNHCTREETIERKQFIYRYLKNNCSEKPVHGIFLSLIQELADKFSINKNTARAFVYTIVKKYKKEGEIFYINTNPSKANVLYLGKRKLNTDDLDKIVINRASRVILKHLRLNNWKMVLDKNLIKDIKEDIRIKCNYTIMNNIAYIFKCSLTSLTNGGILKIDGQTRRIYYKNRSYPLFDFNYSTVSLNTDLIEIKDTEADTNFTSLENSMPEIITSRPPLMEASDGTDLIRKIAREEVKKELKNFNKEIYQDLNILIQTSLRMAKLCEKMANSYFNNNKAA